MISFLADDNKHRGMQTAIERAARMLGEVDIVARCAALGLPPPWADGRLSVSFLSRAMEFTPPSWNGTLLASGNKVHPADQLLVMHYLLCNVPPHPSGEWITFRQFAGGQFYWGPFRSRTIVPLVEEVGGDLETLRLRLDRFDWSPMAVGDLGAVIRVFGEARVAVVYRLGDDEFGASADFLFDSSLKQVYGAEDAAALASRVCLGLRANPCTVCSGCGLCDSRPIRNAEMKGSV